MSGVLGQSLALCASRHVAHTCLYVQFPGKMQAPQFHDMQMLFEMHLKTGEVAVGARAVGGCKHRRAHCARVWSTSWHSVQNRAPWPVPRPSIVNASIPGREYCLELISMNWPELIYPPAYGGMVQCGVLDRWGRPASAPGRSVEVAVTSVLNCC